MGPAVKDKSLLVVSEVQLDQPGSEAISAAASAVAAL
jgi:hypothetical protein